MAHVFVGLSDEAAVTALRPDLRALAALSATTGVHAGVNCFAGSGSRWKTRMFAPGDGVIEDPATGSAAGPLACHLARHGKTRWGDEIELHQGAEVGRPSILWAKASGSASGIEDVRVGGLVNLLGRGELTW
jgi:trans-2,3-dihydro-3-hydroxyanthranilate isomerase